MALFIYEHCWRGRDDCTAIHCTASEPDGTTEDQIMDLDYEPTSFVCCGQNTAESRIEDQDRYRLCFKNQATDECSDNDMQDLTSIMAVISAAMNFDAVMKVKNGIVEIPAVNDRVD